MKLPNQATTEAHLSSAQGQGISSLDDFAEMDKEGAELVFCQQTRPGDWCELTAVGQLNFGLVYFYVHHNYRGGCLFNFESVTLADVKRLKDQEQLKRNHKDPTIVPTIDFEDWAKTMDSLEQWVRGHRGVYNNSSLGYVIRKPPDLFPPADADDPAMGAAGSIYVID
jgi:hypothetical protein